MRIEAAPSVAGVLEKVRGVRSGELTFTIGTGCCDSTAPFLYENHLVGADARQVGDIEGIPVWAPEWLAEKYEDETLTIDVDESEDADSFSVETEFSCRFVLR
ncbi:MAG: DUF779 domain-containing protein [Actinobacteria bacterium ATB1]|nr:DUF779 domain-containing protein [Actinobacteria bacterium ATB1]RIK01927.1 MAG: hypothetical protein DCC48_18585 [Acidobacteriota bacterium]